MFSESFVFASVVVSLVLSYTLTKAQGGGPLMFWICVLFYWIGIFLSKQVI